MANRLHAALFREAVYLVYEGVMREEALDDVVTAWIGMRWAVAGPFRTSHLDGGPGCLPDFRLHLGPALQALWSRLGTPALGGPTTESLSRQAQDFDGSVAELARRRDEARVRLIRALDEAPA